MSGGALQAVLMSRACMWSYATSTLHRLMAVAQLWEEREGSGRARLLWFSPCSSPLSSSQLAALIFSTLAVSPSLMY